MTRHRTAMLLLLVTLAAGLLAACVGDSATTATPATARPSGVPSPTATSGSPSGAGGATPPGPAATGTTANWPDVVRLASAALAAETGVPVGEIAVVRAEPRDWPDSSLGCPQPGRAYLDVITPGYLIVLAARGREYEYHSDRAQLVVRCDGPGATPRAVTTPAGRATPMNDFPNPVRLAILALATDLALTPNDIEVASAEAANWPDSSLGCPQPGRAYLQMITPGYRVILVAGGQRYEYHTNARDMVVRCPR